MDEQFKVTGWREGGVAPHLVLDIECGPLEGVAVMDSMDARDLAIDILASQGPYLLFQPPNPSMQERSGITRNGQHRVKKVDRRRAAANEERLEGFTDDDLALELRRRANDG